METALRPASINQARPVRMATVAALVLSLETLCQKHLETIAVELGA
jgi:hypothetical protein